VCSRKCGFEQAAFGVPWSGQSPAAISFSLSSRQHSGREVVATGVSGKGVFHATQANRGAKLLPRSSVRR
jgi:hypothetical protein